MPAPTVFLDCIMIDHDPPQLPDPLLDTVLQTALEAIVICRAIRNESNEIIDFQIVRCNEQTATMTGFTVARLLQETMLTLDPDGQHNGIFDTYRHVAETGIPTHIDHYFADADIWMTQSLARYGDGVVGSWADITSSRIRQQELEQTNRNLIQANENLQQFARVASHDLQEPLRKIMAFGDLLQGQYASKLDDSGKDMLSRMQSAAHRMSDLIRDVLIYSRIGAQQQPMQPVALNGLVDEVLAEFQSQLDLVAMRVDVDRLPIIWGDRHQMWQLFTNLFANALKFRDPIRPGSLHLSCRTLAGTVLPDLLNPAVTYHEINVTDNGIGFDNKYAGQIFRVFQRLHPRHQYAGTGVGLAICRRIAENHSGAITATAQLSQGATFRVYLPKQ